MSRHIVIEGNLTRDPPVLTDTQFAHDGVSDHADVAFDAMRVLAS